MSQQTKNDNFENRTRYSEEEVRRVLVEEAGAAVMHLLDNGDGTFSIMSHIVCEMCDYCLEQGDCRGNEKAFAVPAKSDPYANQREEEAEFERDREAALQELESL